VISASTFAVGSALTTKRKLPPGVITSSREGLMVTSNSGGAPSWIGSMPVTEISHSVKGGRAKVPLGPCRAGPGGASGTGRLGLAATPGRGVKVKVLPVRTMS
jgi:hypothetical protein